MSFTIKLYHYSGENNRLQKLGHLSGEITLTGSVRESVDHMSADVLTQLPQTSGTHDYNYAYIAELNRYYYIESVTTERTNMTRISLKTDVLMTYKNTILTCSGIVARNEEVYNTNLIDDRLRFLGYKVINTWRFPTAVKNGETFILTVNGG